MPLHHTSCVSEPLRHSETGAVGRGHCRDSLLSTIPAASLGCYTASAGQRIWSRVTASIATLASTKGNQEPGVTERLHSHKDIESEILNSGFSGRAIVGTHTRRPVQFGERAQLPAASKGRRVSVCG